MLVISWTLLVQFSEEELAARHESCGLLDQTHFSSSALDVGCHPELTHVSLSNADRWMPQKLPCTRELPRPGCPGVFVKKMSSLFDLIFVQGTTKFNVLDGFVLLDLKLFLPS